jgi:hypothetical protein
MSECGSQQISPRVGWIDATPQSERSRGYVRQRDGVFIPEGYKAMGHHSTIIYIMVKKMMGNMATSGFMCLMPVE